MYEKLTNSWILHTILVREIIKIPEFFMIFARIITKIPNFTLLLPENAQILHNNCPNKFFPEFFWGVSPLPPPRFLCICSLAYSRYWLYKCVLVDRWINRCWLIDWWLNTVYCNTALWGCVYTMVKLYGDNWQQYDTWQSYLVSVILHTLFYCLDSMQSVLYKNNN